MDLTDFIRKNDTGRYPMVYRSLLRVGAHWSRAQRGKLEFEVSTAVLVELTTQGAIDVEPGS